MNITQPIDEQKAFQKLCALCARTEHCSGDMREKMYRWGLDDEVQTRIIHQLEAAKYIDDERYTQSFIHDKIRFNKWGRKKIEQALYQKRIAKDVYQPALDTIADDQYIDVLRPLLCDKRKTIRARNDYECNLKLIKYALGRGFEMHIIRQCMDDTNDVDDDQFF